MLLLLLYPLRKRVQFLQRAGRSAKLVQGAHVPGNRRPRADPLPLDPRSGFAQRRRRFLQHADRRGQRHHRALHLHQDHHGLYGRQATLREQPGAPRSGGRVAEIEIHFAPRVEQRLKDLEAYARSEASRPARGARFLALAVRTRYVYWKSMREVGGLCHAPPRSGIGRAESGLTASASPGES